MVAVTNSAAPTKRKKKERKTASEVLNRSKWIFTATEVNT